MNILLDIPNLILCLLVVSILKMWLKLPNNIFYLLLLHCIIPYFLNDFLFSASFMSDQFRYTAAVQSIRATGYLVGESENVSNASWMLAYIPIPLVETIKSLGFANKLIYILTFAFLYKKRILNNFSSYFFLIYPSIILYTGLSLRDTLVLCYMLIATYFAVKRNLLGLLFWIAPLWFIKFQNFLMMIPLIFYVLFNIGKKGLSPRVGIVFFCSLIIALIASYPIAAPLINKFRISMFKNDGGINPEDIQLIQGVGNFIYLGLTSGFYFFVKPLPWEAGSPFQLIQSLENLIVLGIVIKLTMLAWYKDKKRVIYWLVLLVSSMSIYGLVVFNYGTAARYRFPFILIYVIFVCHSCNIQNVFIRKIKIESK